MEAGVERSFDISFLKRHYLSDNIFLEHAPCKYTKFFCFVVHACGLPSLCSSFRVPSHTRPLCPNLFHDGISSWEKFSSVAHRDVQARRHHRVSPAANIELDVSPAGSMPASGSSTPTTGLAIITNPTWIGIIFKSFGYMVLCNIKLGSRKWRE